MAWQLREKQILIFVYKLCALWQLEDVPGGAPEVPKLLSMPTVLRVHLLQQTGKVSASR